MTKHILTASRTSDNAVRGQLEDKSSKSQKRGLGFLTAQKMVKQLLACDRTITTKVRCEKFTIQELAKELSVNPSDLDLLIKTTSKISYRRTPERIALPLIKLYCSTKLAYD